LFDFIAFIPARGGSKSIPLKNIKELCGRPMIYWALDAAAACAGIDRIYVATDSPGIADAVRSYGNPKAEPVGRSAGSATDTASTESAMLEFARERDFGHIALIQATSPLLRPEHLDEGIRLIKSGFDSALSVTRQKRFIWERGADGGAFPVNYDPLRRPMRQEFGGYLAENGAFYITSREALLRTGCRVSGRIGLVETPEEMYFEVDEPCDWDIVGGLLRKRRREPDFSRVKALFTDCDGVLTDGGMYYTENGDEMKKFNSKDGLGFRLLREKGVLTGLVTGEKRELIARRARKLRIDEAHFGVDDKEKLLERILPERGLGFRDIAYIGDDVNDLPALRRAGIACCPADALEAVKEACAYVAKARGGEGAVREVAEKILESMDGD